MPNDSAPRSAAMAQLVWGGVPQLLAVLGLDGRLSATNPAWQRVLGLSTLQLSGQPLLAGVHADDRAAAQQWLHQVMTDAGPAASFTGRWRHADGSHLRLHWTLTPCGGLGCVTGQPAAETGRLPDADIALLARQQSQRTVARLTSGLTHDFNNLLQVLRNSLELVRQRPNEPRQVARWAASALRVVDRGAQIVARLQSFAGTPELTPQTVQVADLLQGLRARLRALLGPSISLELRAPVEGLLAFSDASQLELAVLNLTLNAVEAMPRGGRLAIALGRTHVEQDAELATGDYVTIDLIDTGSGMSRAVRERAVDPFFTTKALGSGSGLGLSQVHGFVQQLGGALRLQAPGPDGHTVRLLLPAAEAVPPPALHQAMARATAAEPTSPPQVLVVADDAARRALLVSALRILGYSPVQSAAANGAVQAIEQQLPELVVLGLPARPVSPDDLARRARRLRPGVSVVRLDALATAPDLPLDLDALSSAIGRATTPPRS